MIFRTLKTVLYSTTILTTLGLGSGKSEDAPNEIQYHSQNTIEQKVESPTEPLTRDFSPQLISVYSKYSFDSDLVPRTREVFDEFAQTPDVKRVIEVLGEKRAYSAFERKKLANLVQIFTVTEESEKLTRILKNPDPSQYIPKEKRGEYGSVTSFLKQYTEFVRRFGEKRIEDLRKSKNHKRSMSPQEKQEYQRLSNLSKRPENNLPLEENDFFWKMDFSDPADSILFYVLKPEMEKEKRDPINRKIKLSAPSR